MDDLDTLPTLRNAANNEKPPGPTPTDRAAEEQDRRAQAEQMKNQILSQVLDQQARARLNTLTLAKPEKGAQVEQLLINMARMGQLRAKINEEELIGLLEKVNERTSTSTKVKFDRRRNSDSDSDDYSDL